MVTVELHSDDLLSVAEVAQQLSKARMTIYRWIDANKITYVKLGGFYYIPKGEVERLSNLD